jgi:hypothetical protein
VSRYVDVMHETRAERDLGSLLRGLTDEETTLACDVNRLVARLTKRLFGEARFTTGSLFRAMNIFRHVRMMFPERRITVLEIGPGSGYLGALLLLSGHRYVATDITQPFYLFQNLLWNEVLPNRVHELATADDDVGVLLREPGPAAIHVPWWKYMSWYRSMPRWPVDLVTANHVLCEMMKWGRIYSLKIARSLLANGAAAPAFAFEGWGFEATPSGQVLAEFEQNGFAMTLNDGSFTIMEPRANIPPREPQTSSGIRRWLGKTDGNPAVPPSHLADSSSALASAVVRARSELFSTRMLDAPAVFKRMRDALHVDALETPDEEFCRFVGLTY